MSSKVERNRLKAIPVAEWKFLRDIYQADWPTNIISYYTLNNYMNWAAQRYDKSNVRISSIDDNWRQHGIYVLEDRNELSYNIFIGALNVAKHQSVLLQMLECLDDGTALTIASYVDKTRPVVEAYLNKCNIRHAGSGLCATRLYYMPRAMAVNLSVKSQDVFVVKPLNMNCLKEVNNAWSHKYPGSEYLLERKIRFNKTIGLFNAENDELCAWAMHSEIGSIALLTVKEQYRRLGLGEYLVRRLSHEITKLNMDVIATVLPENAASNALFRKLGFEIIDNVYWFDKPEI